MHGVLRFARRGLGLTAMALLAAACDLGVETTVPLAPPAAAASDVRHVNVDEAERLLTNNTAIVVLDIRTPREFSDGHLAGATNLDYYARTFADDLARLDREKTYLVHCAVGGRSTEALATFRQLGFRSVVHLDGGVKAWRAAGKPLVK